MSPAYIKKYLANLFSAVLISFFISFATHVSATEENNEWVRYLSSASFNGLERSSRLDVANHLGENLGEIAKILTRNIDKDKLDSIKKKAAKASSNAATIEELNSAINDPYFKVYGFADVVTSTIQALSIIIKNDVSPKEEAHAWAEVVYFISLYPNLEEMFSYTNDNVLKLSYEEKYRLLIYKQSGEYWSLHSDIGKKIHKKILIPLLAKNDQ